VARLIADGRTNRAAAREMGISVNTVGTHVSSIFAKLGVRSRLQLFHAVRAATRSDFPVSAQSSVAAQQKDS
jgi:DNA-binding NarL/FixJ family response regulator